MQSCLAATVLQRAGATNGYPAAVNVRLPRLVSAGLLLPAALRY